GRARAILADCEASLRALDRPIDLYLLHAPDPRVAFATSVRALRSLVDRGLVSRIGVCNVNRRQLVEALGLAPLTAVQASLAKAIPGGVVSLALERGLWVMAHSPFGGPKKAVLRDVELVKRAERLGATPAQLILRGILELHPRLVALPGARRPESIRS